MLIVRFSREVVLVFSGKLQEITNYPITNPGGNGMRFKLATGVLLLLVILFSGCTSSGLIIGSINGPTVIQGGTSVKYSIEASGDTGITWQWAVNPPGAGNFSAPDKAETEFNASFIGVEDAQMVKIQVVVTSDDGGPAIKTLDVKIQNEPVQDLLNIGEISGPSEVNMGESASFSIDVSGDTGITYEWSVNPIDAGTFDPVNGPSTTFTASNVQSDEEVSIEVVIESDNSTQRVRARALSIRYVGIPIDPDTPEPFISLLYNLVFDAGVEGDGDFVFSTSQGVELYSPFGDFKRLMDVDTCLGLASANKSAFDTGLGIMGISQSNGRNIPFYDDPALASGMVYGEPGDSGQFGQYNAGWWGGEPDPNFPDEENLTASSGAFSSGTAMPQGFAYHPNDPVYSMQRVYASMLIADADVDWPVERFMSSEDYALLMYHRAAGITPEDDGVFTGGEDFLLYFDYPKHLEIQEEATSLGLVPACTINNMGIIWDETNAPPSGDYMSERAGMEMSNVTDFEFDSHGRLIMVLTDAHAVAITDPVEFGQEIIVRRIIGNPTGSGSLQGEFDSPTAVAVDFRNGNFLVSDTGNSRVQVFRSDGTFLREIMNDIPDFVMGAIRIDDLGRVMVANIDWDSMCHLVISDDYGNEIEYGSLEGTVYDSVTGLPVGNTRMNLDFGDVHDEIMTDGDGYFKWRAIPPETYELWVEQYGYTHTPEEVVVNPGFKTILEVYITPQ